MSTHVDSVWKAVSECAASISRMGPCLSCGAVWVFSPDRDGDGNRSAVAVMDHWPLCTYVVCADALDSVADLRPCDGCGARTGIEALSIDNLCPDCLDEVERAVPVRACDDELIPF